LPQTTVLVGNHSTLWRWLLPDWGNDRSPGARDIAKAASELGVPYTLVTGIPLPDLSPFAMRRFFAASPAATKKRIALDRHLRLSKRDPAQRPAQRYSPDGRDARRARPIYSGFVDIHQGS